MSFPCSDGKRQTFAASQTLLKCEELERTLRERRVEWEIFLQKLPARIKLFGGLKSVREEREELFARYEGLLEKRSAVQERLLRAFPRLSEGRYRGPAESLRRAAQKRKEERKNKQKR